MHARTSIDEYLIRLKNGECCLEEFVRDATGYLEVVAYRYLADKSFVSDVVMNTFCNVLDYIGSYDASRSGKAWISKIARNEAVKINIREYRHTHFDLDIFADEEICAVDDRRSPEFAADFDRALSGLGFVDRNIVEMRIFDDMTFEAIAKKLGLSVNVVYKRFKKSLCKINKIIR